MPGGIDGRIAYCHDDVHLEQHEIGREIWELAGPHRRMAGLDDDVLSLDVAEVVQPLSERVEEGRRPNHGGAKPEDANTVHFRWCLRVGCAWQCKDGEHEGDDTPELPDPTLDELIH